MPHLSAVLFDSTRKRACSARASARACARRAAWSWVLSKLPGRQDNCASALRQCISVPNESYASLTAGAGISLWRRIVTQPGRRRGFSFGVPSSPAVNGGSFEGNGDHFAKEIHNPKSNRTQSKTTKLQSRLNPRARTCGERLRREICLFVAPPSSPPHIRNNKRAREQGSRPQMTCEC